jgi:hypothetical protein
MIRGVGGCDLFRDDTDRWDLVARLDRLLPLLGFVCPAWVFMPNHVHLVLRRGPVPLSILMARLETGFAQRFNRRHARVGHLVQNRFRSKLIEDDAYLAAAIAYVFRNPLEAGLCDERGLPYFMWSGLAAAAGSRAPFAFESVGATLAAFGGDLAALNHAIARAEPVADPEQWRGFPLAKRRAPAPPSAAFEALLEAETAAAGATREALGGRSRAGALSRLRRRIAARATLELGMRGSEVARLLGVSRQAVGKMVERAAEGRGVSG